MAASPSRLMRRGAAITRNAIPSQEGLPCTSGLPHARPQSTRLAVDRSGKLLADEVTCCTNPVTTLLFPAMLTFASSLGALLIPGAISTGAFSGRVTRALTGGRQGRDRKGRQRLPGTTLTGDQATSF